MTKGRRQISSQNNKPIEVKRGRNSVIVCNEGELKAIAFPAKTSTQTDNFIQEVRKRVEKLRRGTITVVLDFDSEQTGSYLPMKEFLEDKKGPECLNDNECAEELYKFYFAHSIAQIGPNGVRYQYLGKKKS